MVHSLLVFGLGGFFFGAAPSAVHANTARALASAQIVAYEPEVSVLSYLPVEISTAGLSLVRVGEPSVGSVLIRITPMAPIYPRVMEKAGEAGANAQVSLSTATQNVRDGEGTLHGDLVVAVSVPPSSSGSLAAQGQSPLNLTVEFN
jgi:hypothetical protein